MKQWFYSRQPQERLALMVMATFILGLLVYTLLWLPINDEVAKKRVWIAEQQETLTWMKRTASEINRLKPTALTGKSKNNEALLSTVDRTAKQARLRDAIKRIKPQGDDKVQIWLEQASFDRTIRWLDTLQRQQNIAVGTITIEKQKSPGIIDARINLERPQS